MKLKALPALALLAFAACSTDENRYAVGGVVQGLTATVVLASGTESIAIDSAGLGEDGSQIPVNFSFVRTYPKGTAYDVTVKTQPTGQTCSANANTGTIGTDNVSSIVIICMRNAVVPPGNLPRTVGGTVAGLTGEVVLANNGGDALTVSENIPFTFATALEVGSTYEVTVSVQPADGHCDVAKATGTIAGANITDVTVTCTTNPPTPTTLSISTDNLALSVTGKVEHGIAGTPLSGTARTMTVTNTGTLAATNLAVTSPSWPAGTASSTTCGATLSAASSCTITITPGSTATSDGTSACSGGTAPVPQAVSVAADNSNTVTTNVVILDYGCIYQGGYVFAFDDTTPVTGSVSGSVTSTVDQAARYPDGIIWSSNASGLYDNGVALYGIDESSTVTTPSPSAGQTTGQSACNGNTDGACDTHNVRTFYASSPVSSYAVGLCTQTIANYSDWYLPAVCELGYNGNGDAGCGNAIIPVRQSVQAALVDSGLNLISGYYWSSTEVAANPQLNAFHHLFAAGSNHGPRVGDKANLVGVRCTRAF